MLQVVAFAEAAVPRGLRGQVLALQAEAFGGPVVDVAAVVHDPALHPVSMLLVDDEVVVSALDVLVARMVHAGQGWAVTGLSTVVTAPSHRGKGFGRTLVRAARSAMVLGGADMALFTCDRLLQGFYVSAGFDVASGAVLVGGTAADPLRSDAFDKVTLTGLFSDRARAHAAVFAHTDLALHTGPVDRLW